MWRIRLLSATAGLLLATSASFAQSRSDWHFWTAADGLKESYSRKMSIASGRKALGPAWRGERVERSGRIQGRYCSGAPAGLDHRLGPDGADLSEPCRDGLDGGEPRSDEIRRQRSGATKPWKRRATR